MTSKWKSCFCKGAQRRAWNWRFSWEVWSKGNVTVWRSTEKEKKTHLTRLKTCFHSIYICCLPSGWRWTSWTKRTTGGESELTAAGRFRLYSDFGFSVQRITVWCDFQGEAGAPGQPGSEGARGDRGIQVGGVIRYPGLVPTVMRLLAANITERGEREQCSTGASLQMAVYRRYSKSKTPGTRWKPDVFVHLLNNK